MNLLFPEVHASAAPVAQGGSLSIMMMLGVFALVFYFIIYRPQASRAKAHQKLLASLAKGDEVLTSSGLMGKITQVANNDSCVRLALQESVEVMIKKEFITAILPKGTLKSL
ncbi:MAG: preprotein translocase subunit YajC [Candidatus Symbiodolus clandestinus]